MFVKRILFQHGWPPSYLYKWVGGVQEWSSYCLWVAWVPALKLPHFLFFGVLVRALIRVSDLYFIYVLLRLVANLWWDWRFYWCCILRFWDMVVEIVICCWDNFLWWFSAVSFMEMYICMFGEMEGITSKLFWNIYLFAWFISWGV